MLLSKSEVWSLTRKEKAALRDLFYTEDLDFGANAQSRAAGALMQQLVANAVGVGKQTRNTQLNHLESLGERIRSYLENNVGIKITMHDKNLKSLAYASRTIQKAVQQIQETPKKKASPVDFPNCIFPTNAQIEPGEIRQQDDIMLELKCHFPVGWENVSKYRSDQKAREDFLNSVKSATLNKFFVLKKKFLVLVLVFEMQKVRAAQSKQYPFEFKTLSLRWVAGNETSSFARTFFNHIDTHNVVGVTRPRGLADGYVNVHWESGQSTIQHQSDLNLSDRDIDYLRRSKRRRVAQSNR